MKKLLPLFILLILASCGGDNLPDIVQFQSGKYGSKAGEFMAHFPGEPIIIPQHYQMGSTEYDEYIFQYNLGREHFYGVSYVDFPSTLLKAWDTEQLFDQSMKTLSVQLGDFQIGQRTVNPEKQFDKSITYTLYTQAPGAMMKAKMIKHGKRVYNIFFACNRNQPEPKEIDAFLDSFKIYQP